MGRFTESTSNTIAINKHQFSQINKVLLITGLPGSGKSVVAEMASEMGIKVISMGEMVFKETLRRGLELTSDNVSKVAKKIREELDEAAVALLTLQEIAEKYNKESILVIEGLRSIHEYKLFKRFFREVKLIAVIASQEIRYNRLLRRNRKDTETNQWGFFLRDLREMYFGIGDLVTIADTYLINEEDDIERFKKICREFLGNIINS